MRDQQHWWGLKVERERKGRGGEEGVREGGSEGVRERVRE